MAGEKIEKFLITCLHCHKFNKEYETHLHVDWKKKYYMITCYVCDTTEAFDEEGRRINLSDEAGQKVIKEKDDKEKVVN